MELIFMDEREKGQHFKIAEKGVPFGGAGTGAKKHWVTGSGSGEISLSQKKLFFTSVEPILSVGGVH
jgi:hypothetical protein